MIRKLAIATVVAAVIVGIALAVFLSDRDGPAPGTPDPGSEKPRVERPGPVTPPVDTLPSPLKKKGQEPAPSPGEAGSIAGRVVAEETLEPIAGALVRIAEDLPRSDLFKIEWLDAVECDDRGRFEFSGLRNSAYLVHASAPGRLDRSEPGIPVDADAFEIRLPAADEIPCRLLLNREDGEEPLPRTAVFLELPGRAWSLRAETDARGIFPLTGISAETLAAEWRAIDVVVAGHADPFLHPLEGDEVKWGIVVEPGATVYGLITDSATGMPIAGATVVSDYGHVVAADASGEYTISGVEERVTAFAPGYAAISREIDIDFEDISPANPVRLDFKLDGGLTLFGFVQDLDGKPIPGVRVGVAPDTFDVELDEERLGEMLRESLVSVTDAAGRYRIAGLPAEALDLPGFFELEVRPPGSGMGIIYDIDIEVEHGEVRNDIRLDLVRSVPGTVRRGNGQPVARARVSAESVSEDNFQVTVTGDDGSFELRDMPRGQYHVVVEAEGRPMVVRTVDVPSPDPLDLVVGDSRALAGTIVAEQDGTPLAEMTVRVVFVRGTLDISAETTTDERGAFRLEKIPAGIHTVEILRPPPRLAFNPDVSIHRVEVDLTDEDWEGAIEYPSYPSGQVTLHFLRSRPGDRPAELAEPVSVEVMYYERGRFRVGSRTGRRRGFSIGTATGTFQQRLREGKYTFRCVLGDGEQKVTESVELEVTDGGVAEAEVVFPGR